MSDRKAETALLFEASKLLGAPIALKNGFDTLLTGILHEFKLSSCVFLLEDPNGALRSEYALGVSQTFTQTFTAQKGEGSIGVVYASGLPRVLSSPKEWADDPRLSALFERQRLLSGYLLPLKAEGRILGVAIYGSQSVTSYSENDVKSLSLLTDRLAQALYNNKKVAQLEAANKTLETQVASTVQELSRTNSHLVQKVKELKTIYELALASAASTRVDEIVRLMTACVQELISVQGAAFFYYEGTSERLEPVLPAFGVAPTVAEGLGCKASDCQWLAHLLSSKEPQILNLLDSKDPLPPSWAALSVRSLLALPLMQDGQVRGFFCAINKLSGLFNPDDVRLLSLLTGRVTDMIHRIALDEELRRRVNDLGILQELGEQLPAPPVLSDTVGAVGRVTRRALSADLCFFFLHHAESEALALIGGDWDASLSFDARAFTLGVSEKVPLAQAFRDHMPARFEKGSSGSLWEKDELTQGLHLQQALYLPLITEQKCIGVLVLGVLPPRTFSAEKQRLATLVAKQAAIVIERSILYDRLKSANDKLEQINRMKNEFISMVSHELRTPLTTIKGFVSIVLNEETGPLNDQQRHFLETSDRAIDRLTLLVSDLLDISRIEAGQIKMQLRPIHLRELCQRLSANFEPQLSAQGLTLSLKIPETLPQVLADPDRVMQVFDNLLSNAIKFTTAGGITITATDKGDFVMVSVKDTGSGIVKEEQDKIFDKFYQIKVGSGYPNKGTGLGLAIVKSIVESHRGKVWVESDLGKGADFRFILPRARPEAVAAMSPKEDRKS
jgi:signal transduction histidine kinase